jgi:transcription-repair coupling factor (superfamily II helicase)
MNRLEIYDKVNSCEDLDQLSQVILELADENGEIQGRTRKFSAAKMAEKCLFFKNHIPNVLTREFGIRQQAMYILYYGT